MNLAPFAHLLFNEAELGLHDQAMNEAYPLDIITEVDYDRFTQMLECLPPMRWKSVDGVESFCLCEFNYGSNTSSYASYNGKYYHKNVDMTKSETFFTRDMIEAHNAN